MKNITDNFSKTVVSSFIVIGGFLISIVSIVEPAIAADLTPGKAAGAGMGVLGVLALMALVILALAGFSLVWKGLFPSRMEWTGESARRRPWQCFFIGLIVIVVAFILIAVLSKAAGPLALIILVAALIFLAAPSFTVMVDRVGEMIDPTSSGIRRAILGSSAWVLMLCIPILGWIVMAGLFFVGAGASIVQYITFSKTRKPDRLPEGAVE
ncbi:MAG: hypothetical protein ABIC40_08555 [bacterium]